MSRSDPPAVLGESVDSGRVDLCRHSDEEYGDSAFYLFPVLIRLRDVIRC